MSKRALLLFSLCLLCNFQFLAAQANRLAIVKIAGFQGEGISGAELLTFERLIASYIVELGGFRIVTEESQALALSEYEQALALGGSGSSISLLNPDFVIGANVVRMNDIYVVTLENTKVSSGEKLSVSDTYSSINDIVLRSRSLTRMLFQRPDTTDDSVAAAAEQTSTPVQPEFLQKISPQDLAGAWRGDRNIDSIRLFADGSGVAVLSAGGTLRLRYEISGSHVIILQNQANDPRMYRTETIDHALAMRIAAQARPMKWDFQLSADGSTLIGIKHGIAVSGTTSSFHVDNTYIIEMQWSKVGR